MGIIDTITFAGTLALAAPLIVFGAQRALAGDALGFAFLAIAALMLAAERYLVTPSDLLGKPFQAVAGVVAKDPETDADEE
ncbi:DUF7533 family protein [Halospeciosus flavus]|uniref:Uncharacterized protein n=1 Tax=Halospeciosus flavus TaxID=3032283 RepID=A0ABD5Z680_9EURY|nr:hypothetical protein [Halospeciosus flavus]